MSCGEEKVKKPLDILFHRLHYKLLALVFSVLLWLLAVNKEISEAEVKLKLTLLRTGNYHVLKYNPEKVTVLVEGYRKDLIMLKEKGTAIYKLPSSIVADKKGLASVDLSKDNLILPIQSVKVKRIKPDILNIKIEKLVEKAVPVKPNITGLRKGMKWHVSPNFVIVYVPESLKKRIKYVSTEKVDVSLVKKRAELHLKIVSNFQVAPDTVRLTVEERW